MTPVSLKSVTVSTIKPFTKTDHPAIIKPSVFDLCAMDTYIPILFIYKSDIVGQGNSFNCNLVDNLKESLSKVLVPYFTVAGRWASTYDAGLRQLECTDEGVPFIEASIDEELESVVNFKDFEAVDILGGYQFVGLDVKAPCQNADKPLPSLFVQVTHFNCGSVALHVAFCHQTCDGQGMVDFMSAWAKATHHGETSVYPIQDRSLTTSFTDFRGFSRSDNCKVKEDVAKEEFITTKSANVNDSMKTRADPVTPVTIGASGNINKTLHVKRKLIEDLKREAAQMDMKVTTVDLITACFWRCLNTLPESVHGETPPPNVGTWVEGRKRFHNPPLPESYSGNVVVMSNTPSIPALELASNSILFAANIVHNSVKAINASNWHKSHSSFLQKMKDIPHLKYRLLVISSWIRFPLYEIDFGHGFGKPAFVAVNLLCDFHIGFVIILPPQPQLSDVAIAAVQFISNGAAAQALLSNEDFLSFFI